jgi:hypothetical protein
MNEQRQQMPFTLASETAFLFEQFQSMARTVPCGDEPMARPGISQSAPSRPNKPVTFRLNHKQLKQPKVMVPP